LPVQQALSRDDHTRRAVSALEGLFFDEGLLEGVQVSYPPQAFDGGDR
jgi:hypothetical protein